MLGVRSRLPAALLAAAACLFVLSAATPADAQLVVGNGIYAVTVDDATGFDCGAWTAVTGVDHPAGPGENVLFGGGFPGTSYTTLRSYTSGTDWATSGGPGGCSDICDADTPTVDFLLRDGTPVGIRLTWSFPDAGTTLEFVQEVVVEGPVDGSETVDNTVIRETHVVRNTGGAGVEIGLRKMWDWQVGFDDGPWFGDCATFDVACDRSMNLTADGSEDGFYPPTYVINEDPAESGCPDGIVPDDPDGCGGTPLYIVAGTLSGASGLSPAPTPPELFQFNRWSSQFSDCWEPGLSDNATCGGGDTAAAYFYGRTAATAISVASGDEASFTQYVVAAADDCPDVLDPCTPVEPAVRTQGFWKRQCRGAHPSGEAERLDELALAASAFAPFGDVATAEDACDRLHPEPEQDKCEQAEAQAMAAALNVVSGRVATCNCLDDPDLGETTVGEALAFIGALLASPDRTFEDCVLAQAVAVRINEGTSLAECPEEDPSASASLAGSLALPRSTARILQAPALAPLSVLNIQAESRTEHRRAPRTLQRATPNELKSSWPPELRVQSVEPFADDRPAVRRRR